VTPACATSWIEYRALIRLRRGYERAKGSGQWLVVSGQFFVPIVGRWDSGPLTDR
jgi:hypothetical protein